MSGNLSTDGGYMADMVKKSGHTADDFLFMPCQERMTLRILRSRARLRRWRKCQTKLLL